MGFHQSFGIPAFHSIISCSQESWTEPYSSATLWRPWERVRKTAWARKKVGLCGFLQVESESYLMLKIGYSSPKTHGFYPGLWWFIMVYHHFPNHQRLFRRFRRSPICQTHNQFLIRSRRIAESQFGSGNSERMGRHGLRIGYYPLVI